MIIIKTYSEITALKKQNKLPPSYMQEIEKRFITIYQSIQAYQQAPVLLLQFNLSAYGEIVILEAGDNIRDLSAIGLNPQDNGLLGSNPEWVEQLTLNGLQIYHLCLIRNNQNALTIYSQTNQFDQQTETFLARQAGLL